MTISSRDETRLNRVKISTLDAQLGTVIKNLQGFLGVSGSTLVTSAQANGSAVTIDSGLGTVQGYVFQASRNGSGIAPNTLHVVNSGGSLVIRATSGSLATNDRYNYMMW